MAIRPLFCVAKETDKFISIFNIDFQWFPGFAISQKKKSIEAFHSASHSQLPNLNILEISSKSKSDLGISLSAFNLSIETVKEKRKISVESAFQSSKVFENGGPYKDLLFAPAREAKNDTRIRNSGRLIDFNYNGRSWPLNPKTLFYDWLYINTLYRQPDLAQQVIRFNAFTDIAFNPEKSINCQAHSAALFVSLHERGLLEKAVNNPDYYIELMTGQVLKENLTNDAEGKDESKVFAPNKPRIAINNETSSFPTIGYDAFLRSFAVKPKGTMAFLFGAGTSIEAGIPTASDLIWRFKRDIYCSRNKVRHEKFKDLQSEQCRQELRRYFSIQERYPSQGDGSEYSFYFEECYPSREDRKHYIQQITSGINPSLGHKCLGALLDSKIVQNVWTTNFDQLVESGANAINPSMSLRLVSPDNSHQTFDESDYPTVYKLHGDYRYDKLQNTSDELKSVVSDLHSHFVKLADVNGLVVVGYSGNDESILKAFTTSFNSKKAFSNGLYWCIRKGEVPNKDVCELMKKALETNRNSGFVEIDGFDQLQYDLYSSLELRYDQIDKLADNLFERKKPFFTIQADKSFPPIKLNAFRVIAHPKTLYSSPTTINSWHVLRERIKGYRIAAGLLKNRILAFGSTKDITKAFSGTLKEELSLEDIDEKYLYHDNSTTLGLLYDLISLSLQEQFNLKPYGGLYSNSFYDPNRPVLAQELSNVQVRTSLKVYESIGIQFQAVQNQMYLLLRPTIFIENTNNEDERLTASNKIISSRYNRDYNAKLTEWIDLLKSQTNEIVFSVDDFTIRLTCTPCFAGVKNGNADFFQGAFHLPEPELLFHTSDSSYRSIHPLKGLKRFGPLDKSFENSNLSSNNIRIGIISPEDKYALVLDHLNSLSKGDYPRTEKEYLINFEPFSSIYQCYLQLPDNKNHKLLRLVKSSDISGFNQLQFYEHLKHQIDFFQTIHTEFDILVIHIPNEWACYRELKTESIFFDLHDSLKLYCAKKNIKIQIIEDKSINSYDPCRIKWWLSLGLYVKSNGTPWKMDVLSKDCAFIGLSFSINRIGGKNSVVLGSSQVFDSSGQGMRFQLQPMSDARIIGRNAFMSKEDARRFILRLKDTYYKINSGEKLKKIVIHKTTFFTRDEIEGIAQALDGIESVELLQIKQSSNWRGIRGDTFKKQPHGYPVERGTVVQIDNFSFLLWTHGTITHPDVNSGKGNYYKGKRGIPQPLLIKRFQGSDDIRNVAADILALTKTNWNSGELYRTLPATLDFSKTVSQMSKQTESLENIAYDFRLFI